MFSKIKHILQEVNTYVALVPPHTAWHQFLITTDMLWCGLRFGSSPSNYYHFDFQHATCSERKTFVTHRLSNKLMRKYNGNTNTDVLYDKLMFSDYFNQYCGRACFDSKTVSFDDLKPYIGQRIIYKPLRGGQGRGIAVFHLKEESLAKDVNEIHGLSCGVVESWIVQHPAMQSFCPDSVNPIRIQTICSNGKASCICATLTVGCKGKEFANASSDALFALVDVKTGLVNTNGCDYHGNLYIKHPESNVAFNGFQIPNWGDVLRIVTEAAEKIPHIGYIGWDVAVTPNGAVLIEGNNDPGYTAYQLPMLTNTHQGTLPLFKPYLK